MSSRLRVPQALVEYPCCAWYYSVFRFVQPINTYTSKTVPNYYLVLIYVVFNNMRASPQVALGKIYMDGDEIVIDPPCVLLRIQGQLIQGTAFLIRLSFNMLLSCNPVL